MKEKSQRAFVICTAHKGVFFGYTDEPSGETVTLANARMCVYWSSDMKGVMGLASKGPSNGCKIGDAVPSIELRNVTAAIECSDAAVKKWEDASWRS